MATLCVKDASLVLDSEWSPNPSRPFSEVSSRLRADLGTASLTQRVKVLPDLYSVHYSDRGRTLCAEILSPGNCQWLYVTSSL